MSEHSAQGMAYPEGVSWDTPIEGGTLTDMLDEAVAKFASRPALSFEGYKLNYRQFGKQVDLAARGLIDLGVRPGDRVGLFMPNTPYYPIMFFAALKAGAAIVDFNSAYKDTPAKLEAQIKDSGTKVMVTMDLKPFFDGSKAALDKNLLEDIVFCPMSGVLPFFKSLGFQFKAATSSLPRNLELASIDIDNDRIVSFDDLIAFGKDDDPRIIPGIDKNQLANIPYTSGSTKAPKGVMLEHRNLVANIQQIESVFGWRKNRPQSESLMVPGQEKFLAALPFYHSFGKIGLLVGIHMGGEIQIIADARDTKKILETIHKSKATILQAVPLLLNSIVSSPDLKKYNLHSIRDVLSGGAALQSNVRESFEKATGCKIYQGYGSTETSPVITSNPPLPAENCPDSVGIPYPRTEIKIIDLDRPERTLPSGKIGEIYVRGPQVMRGYWKNPEETEKALTKDGWYRTSDIGYLDKETGYLHITGRTGRMRKINGIRISDEVVEKGICDDPVLGGMIAECVVFGVNSGGLKESMIGVIRFKPEIKNPPTPKEIRNILMSGGNLTKHEVPLEFRITTDPLPKGDTGKPDWKKMEKDEAERRSSAALFSSSNKPTL